MKTELDPRVLENFERAFSDCTGSCLVTCSCGKVFYNYLDRGCWDEGEIEALESNPGAHAVDYTIGHLSFHGKTFANACDCWHESAAKIIEFIDWHAPQIADWLKLEKKRKQSIADASPTAD